MAKAKRKAQGKAKAKRKAQGKAKAHGLAKGDRVKVLSGDYGQARGVVESFSASGRPMVRLDNQAHGEPVSFDPANLVPAVIVRRDR